MFKKGTQKCNVSVIAVKNLETAKTVLFKRIKSLSNHCSAVAVGICLKTVLGPTTTGLAPSSRPDSHSTSEALTPTTPTSSGQNRLGGAPSVNIISGLASGPGMDHMKAGGLAGLLGPPPKAPRGRKKIKAENPSGPLLVVPYPILADQGCVTIAPKEGKTYRLDAGNCYCCFQASGRGNDISFQCWS